MPQLAKALDGYTLNTDASAGLEEHAFAFWERGGASGCTSPEGLRTEGLQHDTSGRQRHRTCEVPHSQIDSSPDNYFGIAGQLEDRTIRDSRTG